MPDHHVAGATRYRHRAQCVQVLFLRVRVRRQVRQPLRQVPVEAGHQGQRALLGRRVGQIEDALRVERQRLRKIEIPVQVGAGERRIRALENTAYFEVVTADDRPVFRVGPGGVRVYNAQGMAVAAIGTSDNGGYFSGRSTAGFGDGSIGASGVRAGVRLMETDLSRLELSFQNGRGSIRVPAGSGTIVGVGQTATGAGALIVGTIPGHLRLSLTVTDGRAMAAANGEGDSGGIALVELMDFGSAAEELAALVPELEGDEKFDALMALGHAYVWTERDEDVLATVKTASALLPEVDDDTALRTSRPNES